MARSQGRQLGVLGPVGSAGCGTLHAADIPMPSDPRRSCPAPAPPRRAGAIGGLWGTVCSTNIGFACACPLKTAKTRQSPSMSTVNMNCKGLDLCVPLEYLSVYARYLKLQLLGHARIPTNWSVPSGEKHDWLRTWGRPHQYADDGTLAATDASRYVFSYTCVRYAFIARSQSRISSVPVNAAIIVWSNRRPTIGCCTLRAVWPWVCLRSP